MTIQEFDAYKSTVQLKMNGAKNHDITSKLCGIEGLILDGFSDIPHFKSLIEKTQVEINKLLNGITETKYAKNKEFVAYTTVGD